jgi:hypothetical protein
MKKITNERLIKRNRLVGQVLTIGSLAILAVSLYLSFQTSSQFITYSFLGLILGFILSQVGIFYTNRWGRRPRPDEVIDDSLKGLDDKYALYHYVTPVSHLLLGPAGIWILLPYNQGGKITFEKNRWRQKGGNFYLKFFAQEGLGRPDLEVSSNTSDLKRFLDRNLSENKYPPINAMLVFTNDKASIEVSEAPVPTLPAKKMKDFIRKTARDFPADMASITTVKDLFYTES